MVPDLFDRTVSWLPEELEYVKTLGQGAFGLVLLCNNTFMGKQFAVKFRNIRDDVASRAQGYGIDDRWIFLREGRLSEHSRKNPYVPEIGWAGRREGIEYIAQEYVEGETLDAYVKRNPDYGERWKIAREIVQGVTYIHQDGIIHNDIKPSNIMITRNNDPSIVDFSVHSFLGEQPFMKGARPFQAPETIMQGEISQATDVWALSVTLYFLFTGRLPFASPIKDWTGLDINTLQGQQEMLAHAICYEPAPSLDRYRSVGSDIYTLIVGGLEKSPGRRFQTAGHMHKHWGWLMKKNKIYAAAFTVGAGIAYLINKYLI